MPEFATADSRTATLMSSDLTKAPTLLVIDDDPLVRTTFVRMLERQGVRALSAEDGDSGLTTFRRGVLDGLPGELRQTVLDETCALLAPALQDEDGNWVADYVRLRFVAHARS